MQRGITRDQAARLHEQATRCFQWCRRVRERLEKFGYGPADPLYHDALAAENGMHSLMIAAHYARCPGGVGGDHLTPRAVPPK